LNVTQTTALLQPQIVSSGSVITVTGIGAAKPSLDFLGTRYLLRSFLNFTDYSTFSIQKLTSTPSGGSVAYQNGSTGGWGLNTSSASGSKYSYYEAGVADHDFGTPNTNLRLLSGIRVQSSALLNAYINATLFTLSPSSVITPTGNLLVGAFQGGLIPLSGNQSELIFYSSNQTSNITGIQTNINTYYAIY
jgi:hypothetical protein